MSNFRFWILILFCYLQIIQIILVKSEPELNLLGSIASGNTYSLYYDPRYSCLIFGDENGVYILKNTNFFGQYSSRLPIDLYAISPADDSYSYYGAVGNFGVIKFDIRSVLNDDSDISVIEETNSGGFSFKLSVGPNHIYLSNSNNIIVIIDIASSLLLTNIQVNSPSTLLNFTKDRRTYLLCISGYNTLIIFDVTDPENILTISTLNLGIGVSNKMMLSKNENLLYISNDNQGLIIYDLDVIEIPERLSSQDYAMLSFDMDNENRENLVFSVLGPYSNNEIEYFLTITDISDPNNLRLVLEKAFYPGEFRGLLYFSADYLFIATSRHGILVYEYKDQEYTQFILYIIIGVVGVGSSALILITYNKKKSSGKSSNNINPNYLSKNVKSSTPIVANPKNQPFNDDTYVDSFEKDLFINNKSRKSKAKDRESISSGLSIASEFSNKTKK